MDIISQFYSLATLWGKGPCFPLERRLREPQFRFGRYGKNYLALADSFLMFIITKEVRNFSSYLNRVSSCPRS
jgi:hypothetical protein